MIKLSELLRAGRGARINRTIRADAAAAVFEIDEIQIDVGREEAEKPVLNVQTIVDNKIRKDLFLLRGAAQSNTDRSSAGAAAGTYKLFAKISEFRSIAPDGHAEVLARFQYLDKQGERTYVLEVVTEQPPRVTLVVNSEDIDITQLAMREPADDPHVQIGTADIRVDTTGEIYKGAKRLQLSATTRAAAQTVALPAVAEDAAIENPPEPVQFAKQDAPPLYIRADENVEWKLWDSQRPHFPERAPSTLAFACKRADILRIARGWRGPVEWPLDLHYSGAPEPVEAESRILKLSIVGKPPDALKVVSQSPKIDVVVNGQHDYRKSFRPRRLKRSSDAGHAYPKITLDVEYLGPPGAEVEIVSRLSIEGVEHGNVPLAPRRIGAAQTSGGAVESQNNYEVDFAQLMKLFSERPGAGNKAMLQLEFNRVAAEMQNGDASPRGAAENRAPGVLMLTLEIPFVVEEAPPQMMAAVDFGASAVAIGFRDRNSDHAVLAPLGKWFETIAPTHPEARGDKDSRFVSSHIGVSLNSSVRMRFDPLSLGDLSALLRDNQAVGSRLDRSGATYDVCIPCQYTSRDEEAMSQVVFGLKHYFVLEDDVRFAAIKKRIGNEIVDVKIADAGDLLVDSFGELGAYVVPRAIDFAASLSDTMPMRDRRMLRSIASALGSASRKVGVAVCHPFGMTEKQRKKYEEAGRRFLRNLRATDEESSVDLPVTLVPEGLAAARYSIERLRVTLEADKRHTVVCVDIGASTCDITCVDVKVDQSRRLVEWIPREHAGFPVAGADIDQEIAQRVIEILRKLKVILENEVNDEIRVELNLQSSLRDMLNSNDGGSSGQRSAMNLRRKQRNFLTALHAAKIKLSEACSKGSSLEWTDDLHMLVDIGTISNPGSLKDELPVTINPDRFGAGLDARPVVVKIDENASLEFGREKSGGGENAGGQFVRLRLKAGAFADQESYAPLVLSGFLCHSVTTLVANISGEKAKWVLTGRGALWPPLVASFRARAEEADCKLEDLLAPDEMKRAVLEGAIQLASEDLDLSGPDDPILGIVVKGANGREKITRLSSGRDVQLDGRPLRIVHMVPGMERTDMFDDLRDDERFERIFRLFKTGEPIADIPGASLCARMVSGDDGVHVEIDSIDAQQQRSVQKIGPFERENVHGFS